MPVEKPNFRLKAGLALLLVLSFGTATQAATDITFFAASDVHYGLTGATSGYNRDSSRARMITHLNTLPGTSWPTAIGGTVAEPRGLLMPGDLTETQDTVSWNQFTAAYRITGGSTAPGTLRFPVFEATGNHDFYTTGYIKDTLHTVKKLIARNAARAGSFTRMDSSGYNYSWDWDGIHFINLQLYAGSVELGYNGYRPLKALEFLAADLAASIGTSGRPVFIMQHYTFDANGNAQNDWNPTLKAAAWAILQNYNVIGLLHGHSHAEKIYKWNNIDVFDDGSVMVGDAMVFRITEGRLVVANRLTTTAGVTSWGPLLLDKTFSMGTPIAVKPGQRTTHHSILFSIPETGWNTLIPSTVKRLEVTNLQGKRVRLLPVRNNRVEWNRRDLKGHRVAPGLYLIREEGKAGSLGKVLLR
jgi:cytolysin (calcineurin-like family phosphatase)